MAVLKVKDSLRIAEKDEFGDWKYRLATDAAGRSALDAARYGDPLEEVKRLVEHEMVTLGKGYYYGYTRSFTEAAKRGQIEAVQRLIEAGVDIHARASIDMVGSALEQAALKRRTEVLKIILATEERQIAKDGYSASALEQAVQDAQHDEVTRLIKAKKFLEAAQTNKNTALQDAAGLGDMEIARLLVKYGANADAAADVSHESALSSAASSGHLEMVEYLIQHGAGTTIPRGSSRCTPLRAAASGGYLDIVERLLTVGADPNADRALRAASLGGHLAVVERLLKAGSLANDPDKWNREHYSSPLQEAALGGHLDVVEILLQAGADINAPSVGQGRTALQAAAGRGDVELVKRLMDAGAEVNAKAGEWGRTALQAAAEAGSIDIVNTFLNAGAKLETDAWGSASPSLMLTIKGNHVEVFERLVQEVTKEKVETTQAMRRALEACVETGHVEFLNCLLSVGVSVKQEHGSHFRLLTVAATRGYAEVVKVLLEAGVHLDNSEALSSTALQAAVEGDHLETAQVLLSDGADPSAAAGRKKPPLHMACMKGNEQMVRILLDAGADVHAVSYTERTALDAAEEGGNQAIMELLKRRQAETPAPRKRSMSLDLSTVTKAELCATCENLPAAFFTEQWQSWDTPKWHLSLNSLQDSSRSGCPFCMFFWKQLGITTITLPQPSEVRLYRSSRRGPVDSMWSQIDEPFPENVECPKTLRAAFQLNVEPFENKRQPLSGSTSSLETFEQLRSWLQQCNQSHDGCRIQPQKEFLPTRLLYLSDWDRNKTLKLVEGCSLPRKSRYLAMTHRWHAEATASSSTLARNIDSRMKSIEVDILPLTFVEACEVAHQLGVKHLWIDALCIIQDSREDWDRETSLMSQVYSNSYLTIAANVSDDDTEGIFRSRETDNNYVEFQLKGEDGRPLAIRAIKPQSWWERLHEEGPLHSRGWALQECEMSPRIAHFTHEQVLWECRCVKTYEGWPTTNMAKQQRYNGSFNERLLDSINDLGDRNIHDLWYHTVADYSNRLLTKEEDTLPAIAGLARIVSDYTLSEYVAGLWSEDLLRSLAWGSYKHFSKDRDHIRHANYVAPSWSWASLSGPVRYSSVKASFEDTTLDATGKHRTWEKGMSVILEHHDELASADPFGRVKSGYLRIVAPIFKAVLGYDASSNAFGQIIQMRDSTGSRIVGDMYFDVKSERGSRKVVHCIYLFRQNCPASGHGKKDDRTCGMGLVLAPVEGLNATYTRIGFARCLTLEHFENLGVETFTLI